MWAIKIRMARNKSRLQLQLHAPCQGSSRTERREGDARISLPRTRRSKHVWFQEEGNWVALAGIDDKEFPPGTQLVKSKGTDFK